MQMWLKMNCILSMMWPIKLNAHYFTFIKHKSIERILLKKDRSSKVGIPNIENIKKKKQLN